MRLANAALGQPLDAPLIEVSRGGVRLECLSGEVSVAVAGAGFILEHGGAKSGSWQVLHIRAGDHLTLRPGPWGCWSYLAFAGNLNCSAWLGSAATHALSGFGGGRVAAGQELIIDTPRVLANRALICPVWARPRPAPRVVLGPQQRYFSAQVLVDFATQAFTMTEAADRMGMRLRGPDLSPENALSIASEPILRGSVQVSGDGVATVLMADHQTTGGYPKIATLLDDDTDGFAQVRPGDPVRFEVIAPAAALALARGAAARQRAYFASLAAGCAPA